ncbi:hypothetical protein Ade02nite_24550 [Paractinoplanes deccanensis]|uniref:Uncharacterized protein n=2 Tax=Paractinoplanes deccanensis TaxID=113561 RepID=A0ABQ3Y1E8_9ACTN|nr:hypothetical protein [Actinoplanes deccanensis]GID73814.1 hypothetical protein Ade02nite_24550 [Actinoplanes deccanensis]
MIDAWLDDEVPRLNRAILDGDAAPGMLADQAREILLPHLPAVGRLHPVEAQRLVVRLGFLGASLSRHYQEWTPGARHQPERAFEGLLAGADELPFRDYFAALATHTGKGHYVRDSYASLVRWNVGTLRVMRDGECLAELPGVFDDGRIRSYTGTGSEERFFLLVKRGEAIELAINDVLDPLTRDHAGLLCEDAVCRVRLATELLVALRKLFLDFASAPPEESMPPEFFMDVFRQFAVHWAEDDIPPSGALDPEALKRDFLLGIAIPGYDQHVRRIFPALLDSERAQLDELMTQPPLPERMLDALDLDPGDLAVAEPADLERLLGHHPALADWHRLLTEHARAAGAHLMLSKKFLFKPQRKRDADGLGDQPLVSNRAGTTGMNETFLERLTRARQDHVLAGLQKVAKAPRIPAARVASVSVAQVG